MDERDAIEGALTVYDFEEFHVASRSWRRADRMGTEDAIHKAGGIAIKSSGLVVAMDRVDGDGFLVKTRHLI
jgi:hypothetical protein